jgi:hypothetical protein
MAQTTRHAQRVEGAPRRLLERGQQIESHPYREAEPLDVYALQETGEFAHPESPRSDQAGQRPGRRVRPHVALEERQAPPLGKFREQCQEA